MNRHFNGAYSGKTVPFLHIRPGAIYAASYDIFHTDAFIFHEDALIFHEDALIHVQPIVL